MRTPKRAPRPGFAVVVGCGRFGSELANTRLGNVGETLQRLALESERVKLVELSHDEFDRIPKILDEFAEELDEMGPNPLKGF